MKSASTKSFYQLFTMLVILAILSTACGGEVEEEAAPEFVVTPVEDGQPLFLNTSTPGAAYPAPDDEAASVDSSYPPLSATAEIDSAYPPPSPQHSADGRDLTAIESYELVKDIAREEFHEDAYLSAVVPSQIMIANLGNPPVLPGWFYRFRRPESRREFIIQVVDDVVVGSTLTESAMDATPTELPLDLTELRFDSDDVLTMFKAVAAEQGVLEEIAYDLELVNLTDGDGPTWSVVHPITKEWLFSVSAISGEEVDNPYNS